MLVVEMNGLRSLLHELGARPDLQMLAQHRAKVVESAIWKYGVVRQPDWGEVFAYEIDGAYQCTTRNADF